MYYCMQRFKKGQRVEYLMPLKWWHVTFDTRIFMMITIRNAPWPVLAIPDILLHSPTDNVIKENLQRK